MHNPMCGHKPLEVVVFDNGPALLANFMTDNGFKHIKCAPYYTASNGLAEKAVQTFKAKKD